MEDKIKELEKAKKAVIACLEDGAIIVDFHGLSYWANEVERLRKEIKDYVLGL